MTLLWSPQGSARTPQGTLYEVFQLSSIVHIVCKNGVSMPGWFPSREDAKAMALADYHRKPRLRLHTSGLARLYLKGVSYLVVAKDGKPDWTLIARTVNSQCAHPY